MRLLLAREHLDAIRGAARSAYPEECCGLLLGAVDTERRVSSVVPVENRDAAPRHGFELAPGALAAALAAQRRGGPALLGVYHSHPDGEAVPSARDVREAWPDLSYLIVAVAGAGCGEPRCFRRDAAGTALVEEAWWLP